MEPSTLFDVSILKVPEVVPETTKALSRVIPEAEFAEAGALNGSILSVEEAELVLIYTATFSFESVHVTEVPSINVDVTVVSSLN